MNDVQAPQGLVKLTGTISNYKCTRAEASFVFTESDRTKLGVIAIAAGLAGLSGPAISTAASATSAEEAADYVEFDLDGRPVKGWVWRSPFKEGDAVEVAAEWRDDHYEAGGIARPFDRMVALYPHCSRGVIRHSKNALRWWVVGTVTALTTAVPIFFLGGMVAESSASDLKKFFSNYFPWICIFGFSFFGFITFSLARKWMPFVRLSEKIFQTLGFPAPGNVDLVKSSKVQRKPDDSGEYGTFYFRY